MGMVPRSQVFKVSKKSLGIGLKNIWSKKKSLGIGLENFGLKKSLGIGLENFGLKKSQRSSTGRAACPTAPLRASPWLARRWTEPLNMDLSCTESRWGARSTATTNSWRWPKG